MYWRVRKISPEQFVRQYGIHMALALSLLVNLFLATTRPHKSLVAPEMKKSCEQFARTVTNHLLDTSYITYESSTDALMDPNNPELASNVVEALKQQELLAKTPEEFSAIARSAKQERRVSAVRIDEVNVGEPDKNSFVPVEVKGVVAIHSAADTGPSGPVPFHFQFTLGTNTKTEALIVVDFRDLSSKPN